MDNRKQNETWHPYQVQTDGVPMIDGAMGRPLSLEVFEYAILPNVVLPSKQDIFNSHWAHMRALIWSKGLVANQDVEPRVVIGKKRYRIFILCEPRFNVHGIKSISGKAKALQDIFNKKK